MDQFEKDLDYGQEFEIDFAEWLKKDGWYVFPKFLYCKEGAPTMMGLKQSFCVPDIDAARDGQRVWFECKRKEAFHWRNPQKQLELCTGYPHKVHQSYREVKRITGADIWVVFKDAKSRTFYGNEISLLDECIHGITTFKNDKREVVLFRCRDAFVNFGTF